MLIERRSFPIHARRNLTLFTVIYFAIFGTKLKHIYRGGIVVHNISNKLGYSNSNKIITNQIKTNQKNVTFVYSDNINYGHMLSFRCNVLKSV